MENINKQICSRCHKYQSKDKYLRLNYKQTGEKRYFKICNQCNLNKIKENVMKLNLSIDDRFKNLSMYYNNESSKNESTK